MIGVAESIIWITTLTCGVILPREDDIFNIPTPICKISYCDKDIEIRERVENMVKSFEERGQTLLVDPIECDNA